MQILICVITLRYSDGNDSEVLLFSCNKIILLLILFFYFIYTCVRSSVDKSSNNNKYLDYVNS